MQFVITSEELRAFLDPLCGLEASLTAARLRQGEAAVRLIAADAALTDWMGRARLVLMLARGAQWSERWIETGFTHRGTNVPKLMEPRVAVARGLVAFLESHREYEVAFAGVTAREGRALYEEMRAARAAARHARVETAKLKRERDAAETALRGKLRQTIIYLHAFLTPDDARWSAFGLNAPRPAGTVRRRRRTSAPTAPTAEPIPIHPTFTAAEPSEFAPLPRPACVEAA